MKARDSVIDPGDESLLVAEELSPAALIMKPHTSRVHKMISELKVQAR